MNTSTCFNILRTLAQGFEGAWPYLELISRANGIPDPLDASVVDAYWLGSNLLDAVSPAAMAASFGMGRTPVTLDRHGPARIG